MSERDTSLTPEIADQFVADIERGVPLAETCRRLSIARSTVYYWQEHDPDFAGRIARARVSGFDAIAEEAMEIADNATNDWMERNVGEDVPASYVLNAEHVQRSKLRIETRLKLLAKWDPKRYGDKLALTGGDPDKGDQPLQHTITVRLV
jgi:hypothetical protein